MYMGTQKEGRKKKETIVAAAVAVGTAGPSLGRHGGSWQRVQSLQRPLGKAPGASSLACVCVCVLASLRPRRRPRRVCSPLQGLKPSLVLGPFYNSSSSSSNEHCRGPRRARGRRRRARATRATASETRTAICCQT